MSADVAAFVRDKLGHEPRDLALFKLALTHSSVGKDSYERLEFLGDRVLGTVIARALYERYPDEPEGNLSKRYNGLVDRETCAENGREIGVPAIVRLGRQAREDRASESDNVVGDVVEALIGALFLDGGLEAAERFILNLWEPDLAVQRRAPQHPKSAPSGTRRRPGPHGTRLRGRVTDRCSPCAEVHRSSLGANARRGDGRGLH